MAVVGATGVAGSDGGSAATSALAKGEGAGRRRLDSVFTECGQTLRLKTQSTVPVLLLSHSSKQPPKLMIWLLIRVCFADLAKMGNGLSVSDFPVVLVGPRS